MLQHFMRKARNGRTRVRLCVVFFSSRRRHTRLQGDWSSDVCSSDLALDARATSVPDDGRTSDVPPLRTRRIPLLWLIFLVNALVLAVGLLLLAFTPITVHAPIELGQFALLFAGFLVLLLLNAVLLRRVLSPLLKLTQVMSSVDPDRPGRRLSGVEPRSVEGQALADAFNAMLDRLEHARHEAARTALAAQEAERLRVARELHDEIGQT